MSDFYVGYQPNAPARLGRAVFRTVVALNALALALALMLVFGQNPFAESTFEYLQYRDYQGLIVDWPYPRLLTGDGGFLLVAPGKHGAADLVRGFNLQNVQLRGSLIRRSSDRMLEVLPGSIHTAGGSDVAGETIDLGPATLTGEIVDSKCYFGVMNPGNGKVHRDCAVRCISGGIPPAFVVKDASGTVRSLLLTGIQNREVLDLIAEPVRIRGRLHLAGTTLLFAVDRAGNKPAIDRH